MNFMTREAGGASYITKASPLNVVLEMFGNNVAMESLKSTTRAIPNAPNSRTTVSRSDKISFLWSVESCPEKVSLTHGVNEGSRRRAQSLDQDIRISLQLLIPSHQPR